MRRGKSGGRSNGLLPNSLRIISSCLKTVSNNAGSVASTVRSAGASVAASISVSAEDEKGQVLWAGFDKLELSPSCFRHVLLLGYSNGFQILDVEDASNVRELVSRRDGPVTFLQMQPIPAKSEGADGYRASHPMLLVVAGDETNGSGVVQGGRLSALVRDSSIEPQPGNCISTPTVVRFYSLRSHNYVHVLRFRSAVYIVRCSSRIIAVALAAQIYCFDAVTLENKFSMLTYPMQEAVGVNIGYGPMAVGPRWLAYASNNPLLANTGRLSPQNLTPSPGVSPSTSPSGGSLVARYAVESGKQLAVGIINLSDMGYKTLSKYCQDLLPDGCNPPLPSNSSRKFGRHPPAAHPSEVDNAGMVVVKDFVSKEVISQFRAHTSPISALCFDPSGTLLVTASIHGNNINVFRIMPTCIPNGSSSSRYDWTSSHVHLYKLYRGITTAVIQDICFSHYSQWIAIISSHGTCHIFVLSPFGGDAGLITQSSHSDGLILVPNLSLPWWSTSSCMMDQQSLPPPSPITLSVVSRIKNAHSGWLKTVNNVAASAAGKIPMPSGAVAAVFHNAVYHNFQPVHLKASSLEHILVFSPCGHVIQHELLPSLVSESCDSNSRTGSGPLLQIQDDELQVNAEPVQWWDVCRRSNWPEREECMSSISFVGQETTEMVLDTSDCEDNETKYSTSSTISMAENTTKTYERTHWFLFNAEVRGSSRLTPMWQKSKISFYSMRSNERFTNDCAAGEIEIEKYPSNEVEIRWKDLLPVFEHFHSVPSEWNDRDIAGGRYLIASSAETCRANDKYIGGTVNRHTTPASEECSDVGSSKFAENLLDFEDISTAKPCGAATSLSIEKSYHCGSIQSPTLLGHHAGRREDESTGSSLSTLFQLNPSASMLSKNSGEDSGSFLPKHSAKGDILVDGCDINGLSSGSLSSYVGWHAIKPTDSHNVLNSEVSDVSDFNHHSKDIKPNDSHSALEFAEYVHEGYCNILEVDDCHESAEAVTDADSSSSHCEREKPEEDLDNDDMLGGVFAFCEEG